METAGLRRFSTTVRRDTVPRLRTETTQFEREGGITYVAHVSRLTHLYSTKKYQYNTGLDTPTSKSFPKEEGMTTRVQTVSYSTYPPSFMPYSTCRYHPYPTALLPYQKWPIHRQSPIADRRRANIPRRRPSVRPSVRAGFRHEKKNFFRSSAARNHSSSKKGSSS